LSKDQFIRLPLSFHDTFAPESSYLAKLMQFAESQKQGTIDKISSVTGIPTGKSTGKVEPTIKYAQGMGLLNVERIGGACFRLSLTSFGEEIFEQDIYLKENLTQWLLHLMFCRRQGGAEAWYRVFGEGQLPLGRTFFRDDLTTYLKTPFKNISPLLRMYSNDSSFDLCRALVEENGTIVRSIAPMTQEFYYGYAFLLLSAWEEYFPNDQQISIANIEGTSNFLATLGCKEVEVNIFLDWMADNGLLKIDRQTGEALLLRTAAAETVINCLYDNLV
jgi:hypothetical protein